MHIPVLSKQDSLVDESRYQEAAEGHQSSGSRSTILMTNNYCAQCLYDVFTSLSLFIACPELIPERTVDKLSHSNCSPGHV